MIESVAKL